MAKKKLKRIRADETYYSEEIAGDVRNHNFTASFDVNDGYVGINQKVDDDDELNRVLLSPSQFQALVKFVKDNTAR